MAAYLSAREVAARWAVSRATLYRGVKSGHFPRQVKFAGRVVRWSLREVEAFEERLAADGGVAAGGRAP